MTREPRDSTRLPGFPMTHQPTSSPGDEDPSVLFEEFLRAFDAGRTPDLDALYLRAGARANELRKRIEVFRTLQELSDTIQPLPEDTEQQDLGALADIEKLGRFANLVKIAVTRLSIVFLAEDTQLKRRVALKVLLHSSFPLVSSRTWMRNEGVSLARLEHPGIVRVYEIGETVGSTYVAMEYLPGPRLDEVIRGLKQRAAGADVSKMTMGVVASVQHLESIPARVRFALQLARALAYCHGQNVVHRDIKPSNVMLDGAHDPKLIDFGLAHHGEAESTHLTEQFVGTAAYIAPEQVDDQRTGASVHADQFAFGVVLYELLTTTNPFLEESQHKTMRAISRAEPASLRKRNASIPPDLERICLHCLERKAEDRYASMDDVVADLEAFVDLRAISLAPPSPWKLASLWVRRNAREVTIGASVLVPLTLLLIALWFVDARRKHTAFEHELEDWISTIDGLLAPNDFAKRYGAAGGSLAAAAELDRSVYGRLFGDELVPDIHGHLMAVSKRLSEVLASARTASTAAGFAASEFEREIQERWGKVFGLDAAYVPESEWNKEDRERGQVDFPRPHPETVVKLWRFGELDMSGNSPLKLYDDRTGLSRGLYLLQWYAPNGAFLAEAEFRVRLEEKRWRLDLKPLDPRVRELFVQVPATQVSLGEQGAIDVPSFWMMKRLVLWSDLEQDPELAKSSRDRWMVIATTMLHRTIEASEPAALLRDDADRVARSFGARIPTLGEFLAMEDQKLLAGTAGAGGEAIAVAPSAMGTYYISYERRSRASLDLALEGSFAANTGGPIAFRLVITDIPN